ncbi:nuclear RNA export factor 3-like [Tenrec ecaudatus]|uniref:nuclear RNA export factor 3-like n=1 Tax=Tenrec ecaudatus TaxID=94439 RepID=UPI003F593184
MAAWFGDGSGSPPEPPSAPGAPLQPAGPELSCEPGGDTSMAAGHSVGNKKKLHRAKSASKKNRQADSLPKKKTIRWTIPLRTFAKSPQQVCIEATWRPLPNPLNNSGQKRDGDAEMSDTKGRLGIRFSPYAIRDRAHKGDQTRGNVDSEENRPDGALDGDRQDSSTTMLFKTTFPIGMRYKNLQVTWSKKQCQVPFVPSKVINVKTVDDNSETLHLLGRHSAPGVMANDPEPGPNLRSDPGASLQISEGNMPTALSCHSVGRPNTMQDATECYSLDLSKNQLPAQCEGMLDKVKEPEPEEMCAGRKPLGTTLPDEPTNVSDLVDLFPKFLCLEGQQLPRTTVSDTEGSKRLPVSKGSDFEFNILENLALKFLKQYCWVYDCCDRQGLLDAYHEEACFSMTLPSHPEDLALSSLGKYFRGSGNMKEQKDSVPRTQLLKRTKGEIIDFLRVLPPTQHDLNSFTVDMCVYSQKEKVLYFSVNGHIKEVEGMCEASVCTFTRKFILRTGSDSSIRIFKDQLTVADVSPKESQSAFFTPGPSFGAPSSQEQQ